MNFQQTYTYFCTSGQLFLRALKFTDTIGGVCLKEWHFLVREEREEAETWVNFDPASQLLTFVTGRTDLGHFGASLRVIRGNGLLLQETHIDFWIFREGTSSRQIPVTPISVTL